MKFKELINEKWVKTWNMMKHGAVDLFLNPNSKEMNDIYKNSFIKSVRIAAIDKPNPDIYAWDGEVLHGEIQKWLKFDMGFHYQQGDDYIESTHHKYWADYKNKKQLFKKLKKIFLKSKQVKIWNERKMNYDLFEL